jgi:hypothetical protein
MTEDDLAAPTPRLRRWTVMVPERFTVTAPDGFEECDLDACLDLHLRRIDGSGIEVEDHGLPLGFRDDGVVEDDERPEAR